MVNDLCSNEDIFNNAKCDFQDALKESGYDYNIEYKEKGHDNKNKRTRSRQVLWFNPPYSCHVKTDLGRKFLKIIDKIFKKSHPLRKIFNRSCMKISYQTSPNLAQIIANHNAKILKKGVLKPEKDCTCRKNKIFVYMHSSTHLISYCFHL